MLQFMGSQRVGHDLATELNRTELIDVLLCLLNFTVSEKLAVIPLVPFAACPDKFWLLEIFFFFNVALRILTVIFQV